MSYTRAKLRERISALPTGGYITVDSRLDPGHMDYLINSARAFIVCERWKQYGEIPPVYYQPLELTYDRAAQDDDACYTIFNNVPSIISLDGRASGIGFVGNINCMKRQFREVTTLGQMASYQSDRIMKAGRKAYVLYRNGTIMVWYKDKIKEFTMDIIAANPSEVPSFNVEHDLYPIDTSDIPKMETYLMQGSMGLIYRTLIDRVNDQRDVTVPPQPTTA